MKLISVLFMLAINSIAFCQKKFYLAEVGTSNVYIGNKTYDAYWKPITAYKIGFGRDYLKSNFGFSYQVYFTSLGTYNKYDSLVHRLPYLGISVNALYKYKRFLISTGPYLSYCLDRTISKTNGQKNYEYIYSRKDLGFSMQPQFKLFEFFKSECYLFTDLFISLIPVYSTDSSTGGVSLTVNENTRNYGGFIGLKLKMK